MAGQAQVAELGAQRGACLHGQPTGCRHAAALQLAWLVVFLAAAAAPAWSETPQAVQLSMVQPVLNRCTCGITTSLLPALEDLEAFAQAFCNCTLPAKGTTLSSMDLVFMDPHVAINATHKLRILALPPGLEALRIRGAAGDNGLEPAHFRCEASSQGSAGQAAAAGSQGEVDDLAIQIRVPPDSGGRPWGGLLELNNLWVSDCPNGGVGIFIMPGSLPARQVPLIRVLHARFSNVSSRSHSAFLGSVAQAAGLADSAGSSSVDTWPSALVVLSGGNRVDVKYSDIILQGSLPAGSDRGFRLG